MLEPPTKGTAYIMAAEQKKDAPKQELKVIKFLVGQPPYNAGETAGFPPEIADRYLTARTKGGQRIAETADAPEYLKAFESK